MTLTWFLCHFSVTSTKSSDTNFAVFPAQEDAGEFVRSTDTHAFKQRQAFLTKAK